MRDTPGLPCARASVWRRHMPLALVASILGVLGVGTTAVPGQVGSQTTQGGSTFASPPPMPAREVSPAPVRDGRRSTRTEFPADPRPTDTSDGDTLNTRTPVARAKSAANTAIASRDSSEPDPKLSAPLSPAGLSSSLQMLLLVTVLSLAPSILIMTTCFIRFVVVFGLLRQALGAQQLPPNQIMISLCIFLTYLVMSPVWERAYQEGIHPYTHATSEAGRPSLELTVQRTLRPVRSFMIDQIEATGNSNTVHMFLEFRQPAPGTAASADYTIPQTYEDVPLSVLMPAFMLSELKTAFVIGFQIYLPFLVIDMVVSSVLISMGMMMLPPMLISLPFKLLLFVMIDGWQLTVEMLLKTVAMGSGGG